jgi:sec-independent protein translocase protein TatB
MFDIGFWELILIAVVALLVIGPERLPKVARMAGLWMGRARRTLASVKEEIDRELRAQELKEILEKQARSNPLESILEEPAPVPRQAADKPKSEPPTAADEGDQRDRHARDA